jgi:hypothetical protein
LRWKNWPKKTIETIVSAAILLADPHSVKEPQASRPEHTVPAQTTIPTPKAVAL